MHAVKTFKRKSHKRRHVRYQHSDKPPAAHKCQFCPKEFKLKRSLIRHVNVIHMKVFKFQCDEYDERLASKVQVLAHKRTKHGSLKLRCSNCDVSFTYVNNQNEHKKICSTPQQREEQTCDQCGKKFRCQRYLKSHMKFMHMQSYACICDIGGDEFGSPYS